MIRSPPDLEAGPVCPPSVGLPPPWALPPPLPALPPLLELCPDPPLAPPLPLLPPADFPPAPLFEPPLDSLPVFPDDLFSDGVPFPEASSPPGLPLSGCSERSFEASEPPFLLPDSDGLSPAVPDLPPGSPLPDFPDFEPVAGLPLPLFPPSLPEPPSPDLPDSPDCDGELLSGLLLDSPG